MPPSFATSSPAAFAEPPVKEKLRDASSLLGELGRTCSDEVVDDNDVLTGLDSIGLHLEDILRPVHQRLRRKDMTNDLVVRTVPYSFS